MKKVLIVIFLIISKYIFSSEISGQIYNLEKRGASYRGSLDARVFSHKKDFRIKITPDKNIEILRVNGDKNENNVYLDLLGDLFDVTPFAVCLSRSHEWWVYVQDYL